MTGLLTVLAAVAGAALAIAAGLTMVRIVRGPTVLDRVVALDVLVSVVVCALGLEAAYNRHTTTVPIMVSLGLVGFVGSVSVARFVAKDDDTDRGEEAGAPTTLGVEEH